MKDREYRIAAIYDTETTNIDERTEDGSISHRAFPVLFIFNRIGDIRTYVPDLSDDIRFHRHSSEMIGEIETLIEDGISGGFVPIVAAYNLMFDLQPMMFQLSQIWDMQANAQNSVSAYTIDLMMDGRTVLRFWDTFYLEMNGLSAMGRTCGFAKAIGDWDYDLIRTPETPLTESEIGYAKRDVQVIPSYLRWILETNPHLDSSDLGFRVLTKTSLVRQMARHRIAHLEVIKQNGKRLSMLHAFRLTCRQEMPKDYNSYAIRKACFRGGLTFTSAATAMHPVRNVASIDVVSMHHAFINGRYQPIRFWKSSRMILDNVIDACATYDLDAILESYSKPFPFAFHARIRIDGIRLRSGSAFERFGIGLLAASKFANRTSSDDHAIESTANIAADNATRDRGYRDTAIDPVFAFGKLYSAESVTVHLNEIELWCIMQVYEFDAISAIDGECTFNFIIPPDYVTLQSNILFELKSVIKTIVKRYRDGIPYLDDISPLVPESIADGLRTGTIAHDFLDSYYTSTIKGQFNGIYGTQAQDLFKPKFKVVEGYLEIDSETIVNPDSFDDLFPNDPMVLYTFGERIVAGSRMHLIIAMMLLDRLGKRIDILAGDTDSLKIRCDPDISDSDILNALYPLHDAVDRAIADVQMRVRREFPDLASDLQSIGHFEIENSGNFYDWHMEAWNKARISYDGDAHITCAGLSRPVGKYNIESVANDMISEMGFEIAAPRILKFNAWIRPEISHSLGHSVPPIDRRFIGDVTDYLGNRSHVDAYESIALYPIGRMLGSGDNVNNRFTIHYMDDRINVRQSVLGAQNGKPIYFEL